MKYRLPELENSRMLVVGLGLMGGSLAMAVNSRHLCKIVRGVDRDPVTIKQAIEIGAIQSGSTELKAMLDETDIIVLATPVKSIVKTLKEIGNICQHPCVVLDLGSTKQEIVSAMTCLPNHIQAVGCHPMCGGFEPGIQHARADLFVNKPFITCPVPGKETSVLQLAHQLAIGLGAIAIEMTTEIHDERVAVVSHLPYFLSVLLMQVAQIRASEDDELMKIAAGGFARVSSLSQGSEAMWGDILLTNRANLQSLLNLIKEEIDQWLDILEREDENKIHEILSQVRANWQNK